MNQCDRSRFTKPSLSFKLAGGCHVFHSKSRIKGLVMSYVIDLLALLILINQFTLDPKLQNQKWNRKKKETFWSLRFRFCQAYDCNSVSIFFIHTGTESFLCFQSWLYFRFCGQCEPARKKLYFFNQHIET